MSLQTSTSFMPEKLRILSGSALKMLAMAIMLIDHTASFLLRHYPPAIAPWFQIGSTTYSLYRVMRDVGRAAEKHDLVERIESRRTLPRHSGWAMTSTI